MAKNFLTAHASARGATGGSNITQNLKDTTYPGTRTIQFKVDQPKTGVLKTFSTTLEKLA